MKARPTPPAPVSSTTQPGSTPDVLEQIRLRAYELFEQRGRTEGHDTEDWLQAETEVLERKAKTTAA
jgi:DUF2934 family protein